MGLTSHKDVIAIFMIGGFVTGSLLEAPLANKDRLPLVAELGIGAVALLLVFWNVMMYRNATKLANPEFPASPMERYLRPGISTASFLVGFGMIVIASLQ